VISTANAALRAATNELHAAGIENAAQDARWLLAFALGIERDRLTIALADEMSLEAIQRYGDALKERATHKPVAQILGQREFYGRVFKVTRDVLDPRPETEELVEAALKHPFTRVLDLGTGSGCILLSLLAERALATGVGVDISSEALSIAEENQRALRLEKRAEFGLSDWFSGVTGTFDLIVANPPYIALDEMANLSADVRLWEPMLALTPGPDGTSAYGEITASAPRYMAENARLLLEIGPTQAHEVVALCQRAGFSRTHVYKDMDGRNRVVSAEK